MLCGLSLGNRNSVIIQGWRGGEGRGEVVGTEVCVKGGVGKIVGGEIPLRFVQFFSLPNLKPSVGFEVGILR